LESRKRAHDVPGLKNSDDVNVPDSYRKRSRRVRECLRRKRRGWSGRETRVKHLNWRFSDGPEPGPKGAGRGATG